MSVLGWIIGPALPYVAGGVAVALALGAWTINDRAYNRGVAAERHTWQAAAVEIKRLRQSAADAAQVRKSVGAAKIATTSDRVIKESHTYYVDRPIERDAVCLPADRVQAVNAARGATASAAGGS